MVQFLGRIVVERKNGSGYGYDGVYAYDPETDQGHFILPEALPCVEPQGYRLNLLIELVGVCIGIHFWRSPICMRYADRAIRTQHRL